MPENESTRTRPEPLDVAALLAQNSRPLKVLAIERAPAAPVTAVPLAAAGIFFVAGVALVIAGRLARARPGACRHGRRLY